MTFRKRHLLFAGLLGSMFAGVPALAVSEATPAIEASNSGGGVYGESHAWTPAQVTVSAGGVVTLSNPSEVAHGVEWRGGPETPTCSGGVPVGSTAAASGRRWAGACTFTKPGVYTFYCTVHGPEMTGTVTVSANGTTTTTVSTPPPTTTSTTPSEPLGPRATPSSPLAGATGTSVKVARRQHGKSVRGAVDLSAAAIGGRLEVVLVASRASLASSRRIQWVRVGRLSRTLSASGTVSFAVPLTARGRAALRRRHRLALTVEIVLRPTYGPAVKVARMVVEHA